MTRSALILLAALLAGCQSTPEVRHAPLPVAKPIPTPCVVQVPAEPVWAVEALPAGADDFELAKAYVAERLQRIQYQIDLLAAMAGCAKPATN